MKAVVIGGTSGIGYEISIALAERDYEVITLSRSKSSQKSHYVCDVGNSSDFEKTLDDIVQDHPCIDLLVCVVGFSNPKDFKELTVNDWYECFAKNVIYVSTAFQKLSSSLLKSSIPRAVTIGSQWSYKNGCKWMVPYVVAKHGLRALTKELALLYPSIRANHICIPTTDTPGYRIVKAKLKRQNPQFLKIEPKDPKDVARHIVTIIADEGFHTCGSGKYANTSGEIFDIKETMWKFDLK